MTHLRTFGRRFWESHKRVRDQRSEIREPEPQSTESDTRSFSSVRIVRIVKLIRIARIDQDQTRKQHPPPGRKGAGAQDLQEQGDEDHARIGTAVHVWGVVMRGIPCILALGKR